MAMDLLLVLEGEEELREQSIELSDEATIKELAEVVMEVFHIRPIHQELFFNGRQLLYAKTPGTLLSLGIEERSEIRVRHSNLRQWLRYRECVEGALNTADSELQVKKDYAEYAINIAMNVLKKANFFDAYPEYQKWYNAHRSEVGYLLGGNLELLKSTMKLHFGGFYHANTLGSFDITFGKKRRGQNIGLECIVQAGGEITKYFVKTQQGGATGMHLGMDNPRLKEIFGYQLLAEIGVGPAEVHVILPHATDSTRAIYIGTGEIADFTEVMELQEAEGKAMAQLLFLTQLLHFDDMHMSNCGIGTDDGRPLIVDFEVGPNTTPRKGHSNKAGMLLEKLETGFFPKWTSDPEVGNPVPVWTLFNYNPVLRRDAAREGLEKWDFPTAIDRALERFEREKPRLKEWGIVFQEKSGTSGKTVPEYAATIRQDVEDLLDYFDRNH